MRFIGFMLIAIGLGAVQLSGQRTQSALSTDAIRWNFEDGELGKLPDQWLGGGSNTALSGRPVLVSDGCFEGMRCILIPGPAGKPAKNSVVNLIKGVAANLYLKHEVRVRAAVRVESRGTAAHIWLRVDPRGSTGPADQTFYKTLEIKSPDWKFYTLAGTVAANSQSIYLGISNLGAGKVWVDDVTFETVR